ncbi:respiratory nitrate reductase subunit gamma [bacterium]|nr:respiratory nitrate reductase subunit gamma [bacterium]MBU1072096.1 respiratory nitrate reductase subunit gamma [bacterium]MBU1674613.1 respiratory nitrate reductase subunit gamma [bacterium]
MDTWIALARGPLFRISLAICLLGLAYRFGTAAWQIAAAQRRAGDRRLPHRTVLRATARWLLPWRLLRLRPLYGLASLLFHAGILLLPLFYVGHVTLWGAILPPWWPRLGRGASDAFTYLALAGLAVILLERLLVKASRDLSRAGDAGILLLLLALAASGYWAAHPSASPLAPRTMLLVHMLAGNLALVVTPLSKIVHCVLAPLTQLLGEVGWHFPAESGRRVAIALAKENEPI